MSEAELHAWLTNPYVWALALCVHFYLGYCLYHAALRRLKRKRLDAFIPIFNLIVLADIAAVPRFFVAIMFAAVLLIPGTIGSAIAMGLQAWMWGRIATFFKKPYWIGILSIVPLLYPFVIGYITFEDYPAKA